MGVFATRSPFRPNPIGLSVVRIEQLLLQGKHAPVIEVAKGGFAAVAAEHRLQVIFPDAWLKQVPAHLREGLTELLAQDPRPSYQHDPTRVYGFFFGQLEVQFTVQEDDLTVVSVTPVQKG